MGLTGGLVWVQPQDCPQLALFAPFAPFAPVGMLLYKRRRSVAVGVHRGFLPLLLGEEEGLISDTNCIVCLGITYDPSNSNI